jgi:hypothetical protein
MSESNRLIEPREDWFETIERLADQEGFVEGQW